MRIHSCPSPPTGAVFRSSLLFLILILFGFLIPYISTQDEKRRTEETVITTASASVSTFTKEAEIIPVTDKTIHPALSLEQTTNGDDDHPSVQNSKTRTASTRIRPLLVADDVDPQMDYYRFDRTSLDEKEPLTKELDEAWNSENSNRNEASIVPQINDKDDNEDNNMNNVEWITADELRRRIAIETERRKSISSSSQATDPVVWEAKKRLLDQIKESFYNPSPDPSPSSSSEQRRLQDIEETPTPTNGPIYPINPEDVPVEIDAFGIPVTFQEPEPNRTRDNRPMVPLVPEVTCRTDEIVRCPSLLSSCLGVDAENREAACECFRLNGKCYRESGCFEMIPKTTINFCFYRFFCEMDQCEGAGALSLHQYAFSFIVWSLVMVAIGYLL